jgi:hypothetical protein
MQKIEKVTYIIWQLIKQGFKVTVYNEFIQSEGIGAFFECMVTLEHEDLGEIEYSFKTYDLNQQFREVVKIT